MAAQRFMVVVDPTLGEQPAFERALESARMTGASLHVFTCTCKPPYIDAGETEAQAFVRFRDEVRLAMRELAARELNGQTVFSQKHALAHGLVPDWRPGRKPVG